MIRFLHRPDALALAEQIMGAVKKLVDADEQPANICPEFPPDLSPDEYAARVVGAYTGIMVGVIE